MCNRSALPSPRSSPLPELLARNIRVPVVDLNRPSPIGNNSNRRSAIYIRPPMLPAMSDRVRVDRKFNCVTRQRLIHGPVSPFAW